MKGFITTFCLLICIIYSESNAIGFSKNTLADTLSDPRQAVAADLDGDGDLDIVGIKDGVGRQGLCWQNDGSGNFSGPFLVYASYPDGRSVVAGDIDGDGDNDLVVGSRSSASAIVWYENDGSPFDDVAWTQQTTGGRNATTFSVVLNDVNGDNNIDIIAAYASIDSIVWLQNNGGSPITFTEIEVDGSFRVALGVDCGDIDGTGSLDFVGASYGNATFSIPSEGFAWWDGDTYTRTSIGNADSAALVYLKDIDRDGNLDIIGATFRRDSRDSLFYWNNNGSAVFTENLIKTQTGYTSLFARDLEGDGDIDILYSSDVVDSLLWLENNGSQSFSEDTIRTTYDGARFVGAHDFDGDGDPDILAVALGVPGNSEGDISWFENDSEEGQTIASGDSAFFWNNDLKIIVNSSTGTNDSVIVFYDSEEVPDTSSYENFIAEIAPEGFYTLTTRKTSINADLKFSYGGIAQWNFYSDERDLIICTWNGSQWVKAGTSQTVYTDTDTILVEGITSLGRFSLAEVNSVEANLVLLLEGPYNGSTMNTTLLTNGSIPTTQPYSVLPWNHSGSENVVAIPAGTVDWVLVELRTGTAASTEVSTRAGFIQSDGNILDLDGSSQLHMSGAEAGAYYIVLHHRNHLSVMSAAAVTLSSGSSTLYDFSTGSNQYFGTGGFTDLGSGIWGIIAGDGSSDGGVFGEDYVLYQINQGVEGYEVADFNMDGGVFGEDYVIYQLNQGQQTSVP